MPDVDKGDVPFLARAVPEFPKGKYTQAEEGRLLEWARGFDHVLEPDRTKIIRERFENGPAPAALE